MAADNKISAINAAIRVLQDRPKATAPLSITDKKEALFLLAHFVGDIHQPLHVGAVYLDYETPMSDARHGLRSDLTSDGVHPNEAGYRVMAPLADAAIAEALRKR